MIAADVFLESVYGMTSIELVFPQYDSIPRYVNIPGARSARRALTRAVGSKREEERLGCVRRGVLVYLRYRTYVRASGRDVCG